MCIYGAAPLSTSCKEISTSRPESIPGDAREVRVFPRAPQPLPRHAGPGALSHWHHFLRRVPDVSPTLMNYSFCDSTHLEMVLQRTGSGIRAGHCQQYYIPAQRHSLVDVGVSARGKASADRGLASDQSSAARAPQYACSSA